MKEFQESVTLTLEKYDEMMEFKSQHYVRVDSLLKNITELREEITELKKELNKEFE